MWQLGGEQLVQCISTEGVINWVNTGVTENECGTEQRMEAKLTAVPGIRKKEEDKKWGKMIQPEMNRPEI